MKSEKKKKEKKRKEKRETYSRAKELIQSQ